MKIKITSTIESKKVQGLLMAKGYQWYSGTGFVYQEIDCDPENPAWIVSDEEFLFWHRSEPQEETDVLTLGELLSMWQNNKPNYVISINSIEDSIEAQNYLNLLGYKWRNLKEFTHLVMPQLGQKLVIYTNNNVIDYVYDTNITWVINNPVIIPLGRLKTITSLIAHDYVELRENPIFWITKIQTELHNHIHEYLVKNSLTLNEFLEQNSIGKTKYNKVIGSNNPKMGDILEIILKTNYKPKFGVKIML